MSGVGRFARSLLLPASLLLACGGRQPVASESPSQAVRRILDEEVRRHRVPGISYAVVNAQGQLFSHQAGVTDVGGGDQVSAGTYFMACSITKMLTVFAVLRLVEAGKIELDHGLSETFSGHPYGPEVTIRQLLAHTGGVPNPMPLDWFVVEGEPLARQDAFDKVVQKAGSLEDDPGTKYRYSNVGYWLLEKAIEHASGPSYADFVRAEVMDRVDAPADGVRFELPAANQLAVGHQRKWSAANAAFYLLAPRRYWSKSASGWSRFRRLEAIGLGYGGAYVQTSALEALLSDLLREDSGLLSAEIKSQMLAAHSTRDGEQLEQALGWVIGDAHGHRYFGKQGGCLGFHGNIRLYPQLGLGTVYLANATEVSPGPIDKRSDRFDEPFLRDAASR